MEELAIERLKDRMVKGEVELRVEKQTICIHIRRGKTQIAKILM